MATRKQYADIQVYEKKLDTVMKRLGVDKYDWNSDRHGGWVEFWYNGQLYRFEHNIENAKAHGSNLAYGSDAFAQIVLALEDLARIVTRGIYDLSVWVSGMKALPQYVPLPAFCVVLELDHVPQDEEEVERQYRNVARKCHPDNGGSGEAFQKLTDAKNAALEYLRQKR